MAKPFRLGRRGVLVNVLVLTVSTALSLAAAELALRYLLFHPVWGLEHLRNPGLYADYFSDDDYWKLYVLFGKRYQPPANPHPILGWIGDFDRHTYLHNDAAALAGRRPVLLYGDSFARCTGGVRCFQDILNHDDEFAKGHYLLNYGVSGYGVDQIRLLMLNSVDAFANPYVVVGILTEDLDRSVLTFRIGQKPRFEVRNGALQSVAGEIVPSTQQFIREHPPAIRSYLYRLILYRFLPDRVSRILRNEERQTGSKRTTNAGLIRDMVAELRSHQLQFVFVIFRAQWPTSLRNEDWRDRFLDETLRELHAPVIRTKDLIVAAAEAEGRAFPDFFVADGHPTSHLNELIAAEIKKHVIEEVRDEQRRAIKFSRSSSPKPFRTRTVVRRHGVRRCQFTASPGSRTRCNCLIA
jgi:hypothetical protein